MSGAISFDIIPFPGGKCLDFDLNFIKVRSTDSGLDFAFFYCQMADGTVADIGATAWQAVAEVTERFQMVAPSFAPERCGNLVGGMLSSIDASSPGPGC